MSLNFAKGDVVQLKSGSPELTVQKVDGDWVSVIYWNKQANKFETVNLDTKTINKLEDFDPNANPDLGDY